MTIDEKWQVCLNHYGKNLFKDKETGIMFRPSDKQIEFLYGEKKRFDFTINSYLERRDSNIIRLLDWK